MVSSISTVLRQTVFSFLLTGFNPLTVPKFRLQSDYLGEAIKSVRPSSKRLPVDRIEVSMILK